jgi:hypothetical protein
LLLAAVVTRTTALAAGAAAGLLAAAGLAGATGRRSGGWGRALLELAQLLARGMELVVLLLLSPSMRAAAGSLVVLYTLLRCAAVSAR